MIVVTAEYETTDARAKLYFDVSGYDGCDWQIGVWDVLESQTSGYPNSPSNGVFTMDVWGLTPSKEYTVEVSGTDGFYNQWTFLTQSPIVQTAPASNQQNITLSPTLGWTREEVYDSFELIVKDDNEDVIISLPAIVGGSQQISGLAYGTEYHWRVRGTNAAGVSEWTSWRYFTTKSPVVYNKVISKTVPLSGEPNVEATIRPVIQYDLPINRILRPDGNLIRENFFRVVIDHLMTIARTISPVGDPGPVKNWRVVVAHLLTISHFIRPDGNPRPQKFIRIVIAHLRTISRVIIPDGNPNPVKNWRVVVAHVLKISHFIRPDGNPNPVKSLRVLREYIRTIARVIAPAGSPNPVKNWRQTVEHVLKIARTIRPDGLLDSIKFLSTFVGYTKRLSASIAPSGNLRKSFGKVLRSTLTMFGTANNGRYELILSRVFSLQGVVMRGFDRLLKRRFWMSGRAQRGNGLGNEYYKTLARDLFLDRSLERLAEMSLDLKSAVKLRGRLHFASTKILRSKVTMISDIRKKIGLRVKRRFIPISTVFKEVTKRLKGSMKPTGAPKRLATISMKLGGILVIQGSIHKFFNLIIRTISIRVRRVSEIVIEVNKPVLIFFARFYRISQVVFRMTLPKEE